MKKEDIKLSDIKRILLGEAPVEFLAEVLVRSVITYVVLLVVVRLLGKRMSGRLTNAEMAVMLMFGAIVSSAMQIPDRGILEGVAALVLVLAFQRLIGYFTYKNQRMETVLLGDTTMLVKDAVLQQHALGQERISRDQLFRTLRAENILNLGEVKRMYMETNSSFTIYKEKDKKPGLSLIPEKDKQVTGGGTPVDDTKTCYVCGTNFKKEALPNKCHHCGGDEFVNAYK